MKIKLLLLLLFSVYCFHLFCSYSFSPGDDFIPPEDEPGQFSIYLLADTTINTEKAEEYEISQLQLQAEPWLSKNDIEFYDFSSHCIYLKKDRSSVFRNITMIVSGRPFVVVANGERCYLLSYHPMASSFAPMVPRIDAFDSFLYPKDVIHISKSNQFYNESLYTFIDERNDIRIRNALVHDNIFHGGLQI